MTDSTTTAADPTLPKWATDPLGYANELADKYLNTWQAVQLEKAKAKYAAKAAPVAPPPAPAAPMQTEAPGPLSKYLPWIIGGGAVLVGVVLVASLRR